MGDLWLVELKMMLNDGWSMARRIKMMLNDGWSMAGRMQIYAKHWQEICSKETDLLLWLVSLYLKMK